MEVKVYANTGVLISYGAEAKFKEKPLAPKEEDIHSFSDSKVAYWGDSNDFPDKIEEELGKNADLLAALDWKARALYAGGVQYQVLDPETGELKTKHIPEIYAFLQNSWYYPMQACTDFYKLYNSFSVVILDQGRDKITKLYAPPTRMGRFSKQDKKGNINKLYISANWKEHPADGGEFRETIPVVDPTYQDIRQLKDRRDGFKYCLPVSYPTGRTYYQLAHWNCIRESKWLQLANNIPQYKMALMKNQMTVKYHVIMPDYWMSWKYKNYHSLSQEKQAELITKEMDWFNDAMTGLEKSGKTIITMAMCEKHTGKMLAGWQIIPIDDKLKDGAYLEDSAEATIKIYSAVGIDPSLSGIIPGKGGSNRSGSDKREALNIYLSLVQMHADILLRPYYEVAKYNGWEEKYGPIVWSFKKPLLQTLDQISPAKRETTLPEQETE